MDNKPSDSGTSLESYGYILEAWVRRLLDYKFNSEGVIFNNTDNKVGLIYFNT